MKASKSVAVLIILVMLAEFSTTNLKSVNAIDAREHLTYLPLVVRNAYSGYSAENKFIGIYMQHYWTDSEVGTYMPIADNLAEKKHTVSAWFIDIQDSHFAYPGHPDLKTNNLYRQLEALWKYGYISFININSSATAYAIASGQLDSYLSYMAEYYADWVKLGGGRRAFIAPLPEMNGDWPTYGQDPINFKLAYQHIQNIFAQKGVGRDQVWWVFAPNGWSKPGQEFEKYYPGDALVDTVAFSMYNYGWCWVALDFPKWENYDTLYTPYISRIHTMAPSKPIIIGQTGSTNQTSYGPDPKAKNTWLQVNYQYLATQPQVLGILYYDYDQSSWECYWKITDGSTYKPGYQAGTAPSIYRYMSWSDLDTVIP
jgi:hypothetical protein